ncbi:hypothetical protein LCI18_006843 [Fusarium solani-melongenae]|uniref:Uncharacterized protein n=1 Tax=Fusarium solani subsp. cucurbitae TaxID=2747967 RepID=A0ACD3Z4A7_FUSSC|nr:hypothetical protein LCI18_006843 [Fusarium solani-melongenae]
MLSLLIRSGKFWHDPEADLDLARQRHVSPTFSLDRILRQPKCELGPNGRVHLAYSLACTLSQIYSADMQQQKWGPRGIYFLYNSGKRDEIHELGCPYVECTFSSDGTLVLPDETLVLRDGTPVEIKDRFPLLIYFAKLLLEIGLGRLFVPEDRRVDVQLTKWAQSGEAQESLIRGYFDAIMECLRAKKPRHVEDPADEETRCRRAISNLVSHLNKARQSYRSLDPKRPQEISMLDSTISEPTVDHEPPRQEPLSCEDLSELLPKNRMFDEQKLRFYDNDQSDINSAKDFLDRAETFYTSSMRGLTSSPDIRIAILDTGIQTTNSFIRGVKNSRRGRDSPIKQSTSFVSKHSDDECGHGTNVASLILRIFPEANFYIAKISRNLEQDDIGQMVQAIRWARSFDVHIINMSFSIPPTSAVRKIIKEAEKAGVIMFVAASNNGANTGRSFPATLPTVLCIHATDGKGNKGDMNPEPEDNRENLSTLGVAVPSVWEKSVYLSGTSYATPVAAAMAAVILCFIEAAVAANKMPEEIKEEAFDREGMKSILMSMAVLRDGYNCIFPWRRFLPPDAEQGVLIARIRNALN